MDMTLSSPQPLTLFAVGLFVALVWLGPIGLFVLRKHLANAQGTRWFVRAILTTLTLLTAPAAVLTVLAMVSGGAEALDVLWSLLTNAW